MSTKPSSTEEGLAEICYLLPPTLATSLGDLTSAHAHAWHVCANAMYSSTRKLSHQTDASNNNITYKYTLYDGRVGYAGSNMQAVTLSWNSHGTCMIRSCCREHIGIAQQNLRRRYCAPWFPREPLAQNKTCWGTERRIPTNRVLPPRPHHDEPHVKHGPAMTCT